MNEFFFNALNNGKLNANGAVVVSFTTEGQTFGGSSGSSGLSGGQIAGAVPKPMVAPCV